MKEKSQLNSLLDTNTVISSEEPRWNDVKLGFFKNWEMFSKFSKSLTQWLTKIWNWRLEKKGLWGDRVTQIHIIIEYTRPPRHDRQNDRRKKPKRRVDWRWDRAPYQPLVYPSAAPSRREKPSKAKTLLSLLLPRWQEFPAVLPTATPRMRGTGRCLGFRAARGGSGLRLEGHGQDVPLVRPLVRMGLCSRLISCLRVNWRMWARVKEILAGWSLRLRYLNPFNFLRKIWNKMK